MTMNLKHESNAFISFQGDDGKKEKVFLSRIARVFFAFLESRSRLARARRHLPFPPLLSRTPTSLARERRWWQNDDIRLNPVLFSFCLFWRDAVMKNKSLSLFCQRRRIAAGRKSDESNDARFFFKFAVALLMCVNSKAMMIKKYFSPLWSPKA